MTATASAVSRSLRHPRLRPIPSGTPRHREGIRVRRSVVPGECSIAIDGSSPEAVRDVTAALEAAGYTATWVDGDYARVRKAAPETAPQFVPVKRDPPTWTAARGGFTATVVGGSSSHRVTITDPDGDEVDSATFAPANAMREAAWLLDTAAREAL